MKYALRMMKDDEILSDKTDIIFFETTGHWEVVNAFDGISVAQAKEMDARHCVRVYKLGGNIRLRRKSNISIDLAKVCHIKRPHILYEK